MAYLSLRRCGLRIRRNIRIYVLLLLPITALLWLLLIFDSTPLNTIWRTSLMGTTTTTLASPILLNAQQLKQLKANWNDSQEPESSRAQLRMQWLKRRIEESSRKMEKSYILDVPDNIPVNDKVHIFYYAWYESLLKDNKWQHWNHEYIPSWRPHEKKTFPSGRHNPPMDIGANFYPQLGCYSSKDPQVIDVHMKQIRDSAIGVVVVSWYPPGLSDGSQQSPDVLFSKLLDAADKYGLKIAPHVEPYENRNPVNFLQHRQYFHDSYGQHPALYRIRRSGKLLPVIYVYDSYRTPASAWKELLASNGNISLRNTPYDAVFLGLLVDMQHRHEIKRAYFDGFYTYFASNGFSYGSSWKNWKQLRKFASDSGLLFVPSIGPGYIDTRVRAWNGANTRHRRRGAYYQVGWRAAIAAKAPFVSITSFNEWHEGTQIEPAVPFSTPEYQYLSYEPDEPTFYIELTRSLVFAFSKNDSTLRN